MDRDAEFMELECPLTADQEQVYNDAVHFWKVIFGAHYDSKAHSLYCVDTPPVILTRIASHWLLASHSSLKDPLQLRVDQGLTGHGAGPASQAD